jgi:hypothetical protein
LLRGGTIADIPVWQDQRLEVWINLTTAQVMGFQFPDSVMRRVTEVFLWDGAAP